MDESAKLVAQFAEHVAAQTDEILRGDARTGNRHAKRYIEAFTRLRAMGDTGRDALVPLLHAERPDVRGMAAAFLLRHRHGDARAVLEQLAAGVGLAAFGASECLKRWEEGAWQLDPP